MSKDIQIEVNVSQAIAEKFLQANRVIEERIGIAPGAQVLMALVLECEDISDFTDEYCEAFRTVATRK